MTLGEEYGDKMQSYFWDTIEEKHWSYKEHVFSLQIYEVGGLVIVHVTQEDLTKFGCKSKRKLKIFGTSLCLCDMLELIV
jgi:hypothetical protein